MTFGITGHQGLSPGVSALVEAELARLLDAAEGAPAAVTSLAEGPDQVVARLVLARGGRVDVVVPCERYEDAFADERAREEYKRLLSSSANVERLAFAEPSDEAFLAAGRRVAERCDELLAVWDGRTARGTGGTGDVVAYARAIGRPVRVVWPPGAER